MSITDCGGKTVDARMFSDHSRSLLKSTTCSLKSNQEWLIETNNRSTRSGSTTGILHQIVPLLALGC
jgi:hypothetical protein